MDTFLTVDTKLISGLTPEDAVRLFHDILCAEAMAGGILTAGVAVPFAIDTPDGGIDAEVAGAEEPIANGLIFPGRTRYQIKTGSFSLEATLTDVKAVLLKDKSKELKPKIKSCLDNGDTLAIVLFGSDNPEPEDDAVKTKIHEVIDPVNSSYANAEIVIIRPNNIVTFLEPYPSIRLKLLRRGDMPFSDIDGWGSTTEMQRPLSTAEPQQAFIGDFQQNIIGDSQPVHIRIIGEPGIGKSRLSLESLKADSLQALVIYCQSPESLLSTPLIQHLTRRDSTFRTILVVDECDFTAMTDIWNKIQPFSPRIKLVTIYNQEDDSRGRTTYLSLPRLSDDQIQEIIASYGFPKADTQRWAEYCDGSPRVAHIIGWNLRENPDNLLASPDSIDVWKRYIAYKDAPDSENAKRRHIVLRWLSLFKRFGFEGPMSDEGKLIAAKIEQAEGIRYSEFQRIIQELRHRKILQGETTLYITPKLLHIKLWAEWWDIHGNAEDFDIDSFRTIDPDSKPPKMLNDELMDWFYEQFKYANESKVATEVVQRLLGPGGPFRDIDFLDTDKGSKFFLYLAETDPGNAIACLDATIGKANAARIQNFKAGRRDVVYSLQRIVAWKRYFSRAAEILLKLSVSENETWSNNATGVYTSLFSPAYGKVAVSEASPQERFPALEAAITSDDPARRNLALKAATTALETNFFSMDIGTDYQGLRKGPTLWMPETYGELWNAYEIVWDLLVKKSKEKPDDEANICIKTLLDHTRTMVAMQTMSDKVINTLKEISEDENHKTQVLATVVAVLHYDSKRLPVDVVTRLIALKDQLTGTDFHSLLRRYVGLDLLEDHFDVDGKHSDQTTDKIKGLAEESMKDPDILTPELSWLISDSPQNGFKFGYELGMADTTWTMLHPFLKKQVDSGETGSFFLGGYFRALNEKNPELWESTLDDLLKQPKSAALVPELTWRSGMTDRAGLRLLSLAKIGIMKVGDFRMFGIGSAIEPLSEEVLLKWISFLLERPESIAIGIVLDYLDFYYRMKAKAPLPKDITKQALLDDRLFTPQAEQRDQMISFHWSQLAEQYIEQHPSEGIELAEKVLKHFDQKGSIIGGVHNETTGVLNLVTQHNPQEAWKIITAQINPPTGMQGYRILNWLQGETRFGDMDGSGGAIKYIPEDLLWAWIEETDSEQRAILAASFVPAVLYSEEGGKSLARSLLVRYGGSENVRSSLHSNFFTEGWSGPASAHYMERKQALTDMKTKETDDNVIRFLDEEISALDQRIAYEKMSEERRGF